MKNNYEILDLNPHGTNVTSSDVKRAYAKLALRYRPDKSPPNKRAEAEEQFQAIETAYEALMKEHPSNIDENENDKIISVYKKIMDAICHWPGEFSIAAEKYLESPTLLAVIGFLIEKNIFTEDKFITPLTRADWEIFCNQHYLNKLIQDYPHSAPSPNLLVQVFNEHEKTQYKKIRKENKEAFFDKYSGTESDRIWAHIAASIEHGKYTFEYFEVSDFLYPLKWRLLKEKVAQYRSSEGSEYSIQVANIVYTFSTVSCVGLYLDKVNEHIKLPFQKKINELMAINDELSIAKANQLTFALNELEKNLEHKVCQFIDKSQTKKIQYQGTRIQAQILHEITKKTLTSLANAEVINQRRNLVGDVLRGTLGVFLGAASLGLLFLSSGYRNAFFNVDTRVLIKDSEQEVLYSYNKVKDFIPILQGLGV